MPVNNKAQSNQTEDNQSNQTEDKTQKVSTGRNVAPNEPTKSEAPIRQQAEEVKPQSYVWLANGEVVRAYDEDLPGSAGAAHPFGFWQKDKNVYMIVGVYPTEDKAEE